MGSWYVSLGVEHSIAGHYYVVLILHKSRFHVPFGCERLAVCLLLYCTVLLHSSNDTYVGGWEIPRKSCFMSHVKGNFSQLVSGFPFVKLSYSVFKVTSCHNEISRIDGCRGGGMSRPSITKIVTIPKYPHVKRIPSIPALI